MGLIKGGFLRLLQTALYAICFFCSAIILGMTLTSTRTRSDSLTRS